MILGVIATFTIPKVLQVQQDAKYKSMAKEAAGMITEAYSRYRAQNGLNASMASSDLAPYMNYTVIETSGVQFDSYQGGGNKGCNPLVPCLRLHNGAILRLRSDQHFGGSASTNAIDFYFDPDGKVTDDTTNGPGKSVNFFLYYNGQLRTRATIEPNTSTNTVVSNPDPTADPPWFSWN